ncbi:MAG: energy transducer TonB [Leptolyngbya sp. SIO3F4]|nr:energy transducer TonB [Leptolyngbya sp. SIO3F4]
MHIKANISHPCPEKWESMKIGLHARFCENCQKNVVDFTQRDRKEILEYLLTHRNQRICGHVYPSQLDFTHTDLLVTIRALSKQRKNHNLSFYVLAAGAFLLSGCGPTESSETPTPIDTLETVSLDTTTDSTTVSPEPENTEPEVPELDSMDLTLEGDIMLIGDTAHKHTGPYSYVEHMPEFKGGMDSLMAYVRENLKYPEWEKSNDIQGVVYVRFVVDKEGYVRDPKIIRSVNEATNFDREVLRVVREMPDWNPGRHQGEHVDVFFYLPIRFALDAKPNANLPLGD